MATGGKLEKMLILGFKDSKEAETGGKAEAIKNDAYFEALINPETYTLEYKLKFSGSGQGQGTSGKQLKYEYTEPEEITFEFLFDNTGIIDDNPRDNIADDIKKFKQVLIEYKGDSHEPRHFKLVWGENSIFKGRVTELSITYKLFKPDGSPIRAVAKVKFKSSIEEMKRAAKENKSSPDLTHVRLVKAGDSLPLMCYQIYGDTRYYLKVAEINGLGNFRQLVPGTELIFPPIDKTSN
ncbi:LysM peptidoglycan-binding domain-containing protein [Spirosoma sp. HMF4905]|uniref:LysM peptidoglycan-binding domain-containing protein n=1 Tax=Spirosoma arboris TaxID=2682092 RepID=A0A7K1SI47_9BACT|nr:LysM peptidoglycan-binding domain-containing protein [Spirosoma arboris]MVM33497.1 LysM peptidoglycan-binding domain-containing protein [Spirosoma arboris]